MRSRITSLTSLARCLRRVLDHSVVLPFALVGVSLALFATVFAVVLTGTKSPRTLPVKASSAPARKGTPPASRLPIVSEAVPAAVRAGAPRGATTHSGARSGNYFLHWYYNKPYSYLAVWRRANITSPWKLVRRLRLPESEAVFVKDQTPLTDWLRPDSSSGPILIFGEGNFNSFTIFPQGFDNPAYFWSGGSGDGAWNCSFYRLAPPDTRGFRILKGRYQWDTMDHGTIIEWERYWTGAGWDKKGLETTKNW